MTTDSKSKKKKTKHWERGRLELRVCHIIQNVQFSIKTHANEQGNQLIETS